MLLQGQVGPQILSNGANASISQDKQGAASVSEFNPRYYGLNYNGYVFFAANTAAQALSVASATFTGLAVANPTGSGKNLIILDCTLGLAAALSAVSTPVLGYAATVALTTGNSTGPIGLASLVGAGAASVAKVGASATLGAAPTVLRALQGFQWVTAGTGEAACYTKDDIGGAIIVPPGQLICVEALVAASSVIASLTWAELPS